MHANSESSRWALASLALATLLSSLGTSVANVALPTLRMAFDASFQQVQWVVIGYLLGMTVFLVGVGRLGDMIGHRRLLLSGLIVFTTASALCGAAPTLWFLILARTFQGVGASIMTAVPLVLAAQSVHKAKIGSALGLIGTTSAIGTALGPSFGGLLTATLGWRAAFLFNVPLGVMAFLLSRRFLPSDRPTTETRARFDSVGALLLAAALAAYALAMTLGRGQFGILNLILLLGAAMVTGLFALAESKTDKPLVRLSLFRDPVLRASLASSVIVATVLMATLVIGPFYLSQSLGLDAALVGPAMSVGPIVAALTGAPAGRLVDRIGAPRVTMTGLVGILLGALALVLLPSRLGLPAYLVSIAVITASYALFQTANNTGVMTDINPDQRGIMSGLLSLSRNLGLLTGASMMGAVFALASARASLAPPEAAAIGMRATFAVAVVLLLAALAIVLGTRLSFQRGSETTRTSVCS